MGFSHKNPILRSQAMQRLGQFALDWQGQWKDGPPDFERFEHELHEHIMAVERELLTKELSRYDVTAKQIEVDGVTYRYTVTSSETYMSAAGQITVTRNLYRPSGRGSKSICPLELRTGIIGGHWTPRAARQAAYVMAHLTPGSSERLFDELGSIRPSRSSLDRLPKRAVASLGGPSARVGNRSACSRDGARGGCRGGHFGRWRNGAHEGR